MPDALNPLRALEADASRFDFFQALRLLENAFPRTPRIGESLRPRDDAVRFTQEPELVFHPTTLGAYTPPGDGREARLSVKFYGLLGPNGPLPLHLTEYARDRLRNANDPTFARFLDLFHHRQQLVFDFRLVDFLGVDLIDEQQIFLVVLRVLLLGAELLDVRVARLDVQIELGRL